jgi:hypothetical protein
MIGFPLPAIRKLPQLAHKNRCGQHKLSLICYPNVGNTMTYLALCTESHLSSPFAKSDGVDKKLPTDLTSGAV